jgi:uncharacterized protein YndB with AHSA1/START domain
MQLQGSIDIAAPPAKVWPFLVQPDNVLKWCHTFKRFEYTTPQHSGVGAGVYVEEKPGGPYLKINFDVMRWVDNKEIAFKMVSGNFLKGYDLEWTIEPTAAGSRFTLAEDTMMPWGIIGKLIDILGRSASENHVKQYLASLKSLAEA